MTTLYRARTLHTMTDGMDGANGVLVQAGRIVAVADADTVAARADRTVDFGDAVIVPGLIDGHTHPVSGLMARTRGLDFSGVSDLDAVRSLIAAERDRLPGDAWVVGHGLTPAVFADGVASSAALGTAFDQGLSCVTLYDEHSCVASPEALRLAGIDGPRRFASNARIGVGADGRPTGQLLEAEAADLVWRLIPRESDERLASQLKELLTDMARTGLTGIQALDCVDPSLQLVKLLEQDDELPVRVDFRPMLLPAGPAVDRVIPMLQERGRRWSVDGVKFMVDGTIDGGTAWLEYADTHGEGLQPLWRDFDAFRAAVTELHRGGVNIAVHAIGDRGVREVLTILDELARMYGPLGRHRIEHIETVPDDIVRMLGAGTVAASMQPLHCTLFNRPDRSDSWSRRLGDIRVDHGFRWASIRAAGAALALGSDWPVAPFDPRWTMADAQLRHHFSGPDTDAMQPQEALTARQALEGYTTHAAWALGQEHRRGRLAKGFDADLTVLASDPLRVAPEELPDVPVVATVVAGQHVI